MYINMEGVFLSASMITDTGSEQPGLQSAVWSWPSIWMDSGLELGQSMQRPCIIPLKLIIIIVLQVNSVHGDASASP